jgi:hypothetical protein
VPINRFQPPTPHAISPTPTPLFSTHPPSHTYTQAQSDPSRSAGIYDALKDDPELSHVFDDVKANGPGALQK